MNDASFAQWNIDLPNEDCVAIVENRFSDNVGIFFRNDADMFSNDAWDPFNPTFAIISSELAQLIWQACDLLDDEQEMADTDELHKSINALAQRELRKLGFMS